MAELTNVIGGGLAALMLLIAGFVYFGPEGKEATHYCLENEIKAYCDRVSSTGRTCYPNADSTKGSKLCAGEWQGIPELLNQGYLAPTGTEGGLRYVCDSVSCRRQ